MNITFPMILGAVEGGGGGTNMGGLTVAPLDMAITVIYILGIVGLGLYAGKILKDKKAEGGVGLEHEGNLDAAAQAFLEVLEKEPENAEARLGLARVRLAQLDLDEAVKELDQVDETTAHITQAEWHRDALDFWKEAQQAQDAPPSDSDDDAQFRYAARLAAEHNYAESCEVLLALLMRNLNYRKQLARKAMLSLFGFIGETSPEVREFQDRMASALF